MEAKKYEEMEIQSSGEFPEDVRFGASPLADQATEKSELEIDKPTDTSEEKPKSTAAKIALIVGSLALILFVAGFVIIKNNFSDRAKKNIVVATANKIQTSVMPGFNPDLASKDLMASSANSANTVVMPPNAQIPDGANTVQPGMKGNIPPIPTMSQNPIFGNSSGAAGGKNGQTGNLNLMDIPVTQPNPSSSSAANNQNAATTATSGKNGGSGGASIFNTGASINSPSSKSSAGGAAASANRAVGISSARVEDTPLSSSPSTQSSYFLFTKKNASYKIDREIKDDYLPSLNGKSSNSASRIPADFTAENPSPPFGTMLPLQTLGAINTLGETPLVRLVLTRAMRGAGWHIARGTVFVGRAAGGRGNRAYVNVIGYLDAENNSFVRIGGDVQGTDGANGLIGEQKRVGSKWAKVIREIVDKSYQTANTWISRNSSGTVISLPSPNTLEVSAGNNSSDIQYVYVRPGAFGYFLVNDLPRDAGSNTQTAPLPTDDAEIINVGGNDSTPSKNFLSDQQVINLISTGTNEDILKSLPLIRPEYRQTVENVLKSRTQN